MHTEPDDRITGTPPRTDRRPGPLEDRERFRLLALTLSWLGGMAAGCMGLVGGCSGLQRNPWPNTSHGLYLLAAALAFGLLALACRRGGPRGRP